MILVGVELIENFEPVLLGFAGILLFSSWKMLTSDDDDDDDEDLSDNAIVKTCRHVDPSLLLPNACHENMDGKAHQSCDCRRFLNVTDDYDGDRFFTFVDGVKEATPLLLVLAVIEISDVVFAVDSIPAVSLPWGRHTSVHFARPPE